VIRKLDANLGVAVEGLAGFSSEGRVQGCKAIQCDVVVPDGGSSHRMDRPAQILMLGVADFLASEVFCYGDEIRLSDGGHGGKLPKWRRFATAMPMPGWVNGVAE
jgi:hypothetical protein